MATNGTMPIFSEGGQSINPDELDSSLGWLWQTVGATCCWAISDVICDLCIKPAEEKGEDGEDVLVELSQSNNNAPEGVRDLGPMVIAAPNGVEKTYAGSRQRRRSKAKGQSENRPRSMLLPRSPLAVAPKLALPTCDQSTSRQLSPEQNALLSGLISLVTVFAMSTCMQAVRPSSAITLTSLFRFDSPTILAAIGGCFHFSAYLATLCAFSSASSTVITPLMQLSAVWMLPFSTLTAALGFAAFIRPIHLLSIILICAGGFLPAAQGNLSDIASSKFWRQSAVRYVVLGELLICCYNVILHQGTFGITDHESDQRALASSPGALNVDSGFESTLRFFLISRTMNGFSCVCLFLVVPSLRSHALSLRLVSSRIFATSLIGESLSVLGVGLVTFSYSSFYEPSVVNAVEGGLQQLFNLLFALATHRFLGWGKGVDQVSVKLISFVLVAAGLTLSTV